MVEQALRRRTCLLLIDIEPDLRHTAADSGWAGNDLAMEHLKSLRANLQHTTQRPVHFNWFYRFDPQILRTWGRPDELLHSCPGLVKQIADWGDHCGLHCHLWKWDEAHQRWYNEFADPAWEEHCLRSSVQHFTDAMGYAPTSVRMGERWMSPRLPPLMRQLGIRFDLSIESGTPGGPVFDDPFATAPLPDVAEYPVEPWDAGGEPGLTMIPITVSSPHWIRIYRFPYLKRQRVSLNLVLHPSIVCQTLQVESRRTTRSPLVVVLRAADLAQPWALANFERAATALASLPNCDWVKVEDAMGAYRL